MPVAHPMDMRFYEHQADVVLAQANPVSGTPYALLAATTYVRFYGAAAFVDWTVQPTPLEIRVTIDGSVYTWSQANPVDDTWYRVAGFRHYIAPAGQLLDGAAVSSQTFILEGKSIAIEIETTGGTVQNLNARAIYARYI